MGRWVGAAHALAEGGVDRDRVEVDARFLPANERTLLAWVQTALGLIAFGGAASQVGKERAPAPWPYCSC